MTLLTDDEARAIRERLQSGVQPFHILESDITRLLSAREQDRKEIDELKIAWATGGIILHLKERIGALESRLSTAREENERLAKEAKEQAIRLAATIATDACLSERARCAEIARSIWRNEGSANGRRAAEDIARAIELQEQGGET